MSDKHRGIGGGCNFTPLIFYLEPFLSLSLSLLRAPLKKKSSKSEESGREQNRQVPLKRL